MGEEAQRCRPTRLQRAKDIDGVPMKPKFYSSEFANHRPRPRLAEFFRAAPLPRQMNVGLRDIVNEMTHFC